MTAEQRKQNIENNQAQLKISRAKLNKEINNIRKLMVKAHFINDTESYKQLMLKLEATKKKHALTFL